MFRHIHVICHVIYSLVGGLGFGAFGLACFMTFHSVGKNTPNWRTHIFQRGRLKPATSSIWHNSSVRICWYTFVISHSHELVWYDIPNKNQHVGVSNNSYSQLVGNIYPTSYHPCSSSYFHGHIMFSFMCISDWWGVSEKPRNCPE